MNSNIYLMLIFSIGILFLSCKDDLTNSEKKDNTNPDAIFSVTPDSGDTSTLFQFDASNSTDKEDSSNALECRWDWNNDGYWDTNYAIKKIINHQFIIEGLKTVVLEVKDTGGLIDTTSKQIKIASFADHKNDSTDFFPLYVGNKWTYNYRIANYWDLGEWSHTGTAIIEIIRQITSISTCRLDLFAEYKYDGYHPDSPDTSYYFEESHYLDITEKDNLVLLNDPSCSFHRYLKESFNWLNPNRFYPKSQSDSIITLSYSLYGSDAKIVLKKNVGILETELHLAEINNVEFFSMIIEDYYIIKQ